jgi:cytochrome c-type biogenesis protein CcmH/NrfG
MREQETTNPEITPSGPSTAVWQAKSVYLMAMVCLVVGVAIGYLLRGSQSPTSPSQAQFQPTNPQQANPHAAMGNAGNQPPSLEQMKQMADKAAAPALEKIKSNPNDFDALNDAGKVYRATHQFKLAASYYEKALQINPASAPVRTDLATCLYYSGDVDGALAQLNKALSYDPKFFGALLNLGVIKIQAKNDVDGAVSSWEKILKTNATPQQKQAVKELIARAKQKAQTTSNEPSKS